MEILFRFLTWGPEFCTKTVPGVGILTEKISGPGVSLGGMVTGQIDTFVIAASRWQEIGNNPEKISKLRRCVDDFD